MAVPRNTASTRQRHLDFRDEGHNHSKERHTNEHPSVSPEETRAAVRVAFMVMPMSMMVVVVVVAVCLFSRQRCFQIHHCMR